MAEDLTVPRRARLTKDVPPPNSTDASEDLTLPDGRPAPLRVECNVGGEISLAVPAGEASFIVRQRIRRRGEEHFVHSIQCLCGEEDDGSITVRVLSWAPTSPDGLKSVFLTF